jgi:hypothetical protein
MEFQHVGVLVQWNDSLRNQIEYPMFVLDFMIGKKLYCH